MFRRAMCLLLVLTTMCAVPAFAEEFTIANESSSFDTGLMNTLFKLSQAGSDDSLLRRSGFAILLKEYYTKASDDASHTSAFTLAQGSMTVRGESRNVLLVTVRGTSNGEWYSNFDFSFDHTNDGAWADNFYAAASDIWSLCKKAAADVENPVWVMTGYSRGAACANLLGVLASDEVGAENVYAYAFACPNTMKDGEKAASYPNIFNIVNPADPVIQMPLSAWGYTRAGVDKVLCYGSNGFPDRLHQMMACVYAVCPDTESYYTKVISVPGTGAGFTLYDFFMSFADLLCGTEAKKQAAQIQLKQLMSIQTELSPFLRYFAAEMTPSGSSGMSLFAPHVPSAYAELIKQTFTD